MFVKVKELVSFFNSFAPEVLQEDYDNAGLIIGKKEDDVKGVLITLDITEDVIEEALRKKANFIISHHPVIFGGVKKITTSSPIGRIIYKCIENGISIYAGHTNFDNIEQGVNAKLCEKLNIESPRILQPKTNMLSKLVTFDPREYAVKVREAVFEAGAGFIGNYDKCSYNLEGIGTFRGSEESNPFVGNKGNIHSEKETRIETIFPKYKTNHIISKLIEAHPYEEVAYDIYPLDNEWKQVGAGMIGELPEEMDELEFLKRIKSVFNCAYIKHTNLLNKPVKKIALCGGSGSFLLRDAIKEKADIFISSDFKYHQFFDADDRLIIVDIGHNEAEQYTKEIFYDLLIKNFTNFAIHLSEANTNPINYL
jgi:dinuclear metal center YbgI/SA1388 family protein